MSHALHADSHDVEVWSPIKAEWDEYVRKGLEELGLTYDELAEQARNRDFQSTAAMHFWVIIGES